MYIVMNRWNESMFGGTYSECKTWAEEHLNMLGSVYGIVKEI